jgi:hypothetical protein
MSEPVISYIFFMGLKSGVVNMISGCGRSVVTCGFLFVCKDEAAGSKPRLDMFYSDSVHSVFQCEKSFRVRGEEHRIENYAVDFSAVQVCLVSKEKDVVLKLYNLCCACHSTKKGYNLVDRVCSTVLPFYHPKDEMDIFSVDEMHSSQAVVLILRACLPSAHPLLVRLGHLNSRTVTPDALRDLLIHVDDTHKIALINMV